MSSWAVDPSRMRDALALAEQAIGVSDPNPRVGCVLTAPDGRVIGRGHTQRAGDAHAEIAALRDAHAHAESVQGATAHVTLEPCSHHGRTPPCCDALVAGGIARVVYCLEDPNPVVRGSGLARLRAAGVQLVHDTTLAQAARELNIGFFSRMQRGRPWVRLKAAVSLDGRTALPNGASQWLTGAPARTDAHAWRKRAGAVLTGVGTVLADDPRLDVRLVPSVLQPMRVVVDSRLRTPAAARLVAPPGAVRIYCAQTPAAASQALRARGVQLVECADARGQVDLAGVVDDLGRSGINELHLEAGAALNAAFVRAGLVDEYLIYMAPKLVGLGRGLADFGPLADLSASVALRFISVTAIGADQRLIARPATIPQCSPASSAASAAS